MAVRRLASIFRLISAWSTEKVAAELPRSCAPLPRWLTPPPLAARLRASWASGILSAYRRIRLPRFPLRGKLTKLANSLAHLIARIKAGGMDHNTRCLLRAQNV
jgi:hypothetical protein